MIRDVRSNTESFDARRILISDPKLKSFDDLDILDKSEIKFYTIYAGSDPLYQPRIIIKKIVKIPVNKWIYGRADHIYCLEES